jgi:hypothetical protein
MSIFKDDEPKPEVHKLEPPVFSKEHLPSFVNAGSYRKKTATRALRIAGTFFVQVPGGIFRCDDGYLCLDSQGRPYSVGKKEFLKTYALAKTGLIK